MFFCLCCLVFRVFGRFAAVFDNGKLQIWDYRYIEQPFIKVNISIKTVRG